MDGMGTTEVAVYSPMKMGTGTKVTVGWVGSQVGMCTMVGEDVMVGVIVAVGVSIGVRVTVAVAVGPGVSVGAFSPFKGSPEQA
jgi:hypothetical protein